MAHTFFLRLVDISDDYYAGKIDDAQRKAAAAALWTEINAAGSKVAKAVKGYMKGPRS